MMSANADAMMKLIDEVDDGGTPLPCYIEDRRLTCQIFPPQPEHCHSSPAYSMRWPAKQ